MTIEEKAKRYDEAIKLAKDSYNYPSYPGFIRADVVFPELKESEDERIRKFLIEDIKDTLSSEDFRHYNPEHTKKLEEALAWLEKQGEQKPVVIIPKFRIGDNIKTTNEEPLTITKIDGKGYWSEDLFICGFDDAAKWKLVEQRSTWSDEDKIALSDALWCCKQAASIAKDENDMGNIWYTERWLKSIKQRIER